MHHYRKFMGVCLALLLAGSILHLGGCTRRNQPGEAAPGEAQSLPFGAAFFQDYYIRKAASDGDGDYSHMHLEDLEPLASSTVGTAVETLRLTPLGCTLHLRYAGEAPTTEDAGGLFQTLAGAREQFAVTFTDGTSLRPDPDRIAVGSNEDMQQPDGGSPYDEYRLTYLFDAPVAVEEITAVSLCGQSFSCQSP